MELIANKMRQLLHTVPVGNHQHNNTNNANRSDTIINSTGGADGLKQGAAATQSPIAHKNCKHIRKQQLLQQNNNYRNSSLSGRPFMGERTGSVESEHCTELPPIIIGSCGGGDTSITANRFVDKLLDYLRDNYLKVIDPYVLDQSYEFSPRKYVKFIVTSGVIHGITNFERIGDSYIVKSRESDLKFRLCSHLMLTDMVADLKFSANVTPIRVKRKSLRIFCEKFVLYVELTLDLRPKGTSQTTRVTQLRVVSIADIECRTRGLIFPLNRSFDTLVTRVLQNICKNLDSRELTKLANDLAQQYLDSIFKLSNFTEFFS
ncbi:uncharacterized protein LOC128951457 [Oppia nitens]|uniref:uncharacterized protein LOC128951457 n=1 Tax=Oppia nitens TaxID=1686743 RepID=UPI0023DA938E|nr:uncharacterized protein LOC128951457 [Oppia nitens]